MLLPNLSCRQHLHYVIYRYLLVTNSYVLEKVLCVLPEDEPLNIEKVLESLKVLYPTDRFRIEPIPSYSFITRHELTIAALTKQVSDTQQKSITMNKIAEKAEKVIEQLQNQQQVSKPDDKPDGGKVN